MYLSTPSTMPFWFWLFKGFAVVAHGALAFHLPHRMVRGLASWLHACCVVCVHSGTLLVTRFSRVGQERPKTVSEGCAALQLPYIAGWCPYPVRAILWGRLLCAALLRGDCQVSVGWSLACCSVGKDDDSDASTAWCVGIVPCFALITLD
ncbi:unnamed protein product [Ostreobium quekettii]|uniref:Uncharacterized protein n=1 Tax=Ostreobium quekettii TaxID=121088 RepID=A0A8S1J0T5_9CHLO|nr:unnamed protein product [Ostreobium quekettii]